MKAFKRERGFLTFAQNSTGRDYLRMAYALALSLRASQTIAPFLTVVVTPGMEVPDRYRRVFDEVVEMPWADDAHKMDWKLANEWKAFHCSPYRETIKLDADMLFPTDISSWWEILGRHSLIVCTDVRDHTGRRVTSDAYRACFTLNRLTNAYSAFTYFRADAVAAEFFAMIRLIMREWYNVIPRYLDPANRPFQPDTDVAFGLALKLMDAEDRFTLPTSLGLPTFVHAKTRLQGWPARSVSEQWTAHIPADVSNRLELKINHVRQVIPVHYHDKAFLTDAVIDTYEKALGVA